MPSRSVKSSPPSQRSINMLHVLGDSSTCTVPSHVTPSPKHTHLHIRTPTCAHSNTPQRSKRRAGGLDSWEGLKGGGRERNLVEVDDVLVVDFAQDLNFPGKAFDEDIVVRRYPHYLYC